MNIKRMVAFALVGATAITGCVSIQSLDQDLKSKDAAREASATEKMSKIITNGKVNFVSFNESDRLWCAKNLKDKKTILETIESMSHVQHWDPLNTSREEMYILLGMKHGVNAPILEALLDNLGVNQSAIDILMRKDIEYASQVCQVTIKYINAYIKSINDMDELIGLMDKCKNWRDVNNDGRGESSELYRELFETIIPSRMIALITGQKDLKKILNWYRSRGICADDKMLRLAIAKIKDPKELASLFSDYKEHEHEIIEGIVDPVILSEIALNFDRDMTLPGNRGMAEKIMERIDDKEMLIRIALFAKSGWMKELGKGQS